jgi:uncharacterized protein (DUF1501 family)
MPRLAFAPPQTAPRGDTLVVVFLRGAADALNMVVPHGEEAYYRLRPTLGIARPDDRKSAASKRAIDLDGFFGIHPTMAPVLPAWEAGELALIHACGGPDDSRSHFRAMELMERGVEDEKGPASGWIGRHLASLNNGNRSPLRAIGLGEIPQRSLYGSIPVASLKSIADFHLGGDARLAGQMQSALSSLYSGESGVDNTGRETLEILDTLARLVPGSRSSDGLAYPVTEFGLGLEQVALLIKAEVGLEVAAIDLGGWDTHFAQGGPEGLMAGLLDDLSRGLAVFYDDLRDHRPSLTVVVMSEFGRRGQENASLGTDHGHGGAMMLLGGNVEGGKVHGDWPGLEAGQLFGPGDLAVTTDYRDILGEVCANRLGNPSLDKIFPDYSVKMHGITRRS